MTFSSEQKNLLGQASSESIIDALANLKITSVRDGNWLGINNCYKIDTVNTLKQDIAQSNVNHTDLTEYIAASAPLHCVDGWSYLGRALESHIRSDCSSAKHLAYYAELRAAMSLLATEGIGIFNNCHFVVDVNSQCHPIKGFGTHAFTWCALQEWSQHSGDLLAEVITVKNMSLKHWLSEFSRTGGFSSDNALPISQNWLKKWGVDLSVLVEDRNERNNASYRPTRLLNLPSPNVLVSSTFIRNLWSLYQPSGVSVFETLDKHLLRLSLELLYQSSNRNISQNPGAFFSRVEKVVRSFGMDPVSVDGKLYCDFLTRTISVDDPKLISEASIMPSHLSQAVSSNDRHMQVIARAALLLRVASAACSRLMHEASLNPYEDLEFWWRTLGEERGLWKNSNSPESELGELWIEVEDALHELQGWEQSNISNSPSYCQWKQECSKSLFTLGGSELIGLWGLGL